MHSELLQYLSDHADDMRADLRRMVDTESPSDDRQALHRCADELRSLAEQVPGSELHVVGEPEGPHLVLSGGSPDEPHLLLIGHFDTVWPLGTTASRPYTAADGVARGPGVFDMKAGLIAHGAPRKCTRPACRMSRSPRRSLTL